MNTSHVSHTLTPELVRKSSVPTKRPRLVETRQSKPALEQGVLNREAKTAKAKEVAGGEGFERRGNKEMLRQSEERFSKAFCSNPLPMTISTQTEGVT
jgi:hypothetical protein